MPVLATCAGMILLASDIAGQEESYFGTLPMTVRRNAYGRQLGSFHTTANANGIGEISMTFIRAPYVESVHADAAGEKPGSFKCRTGSDRRSKISQSDGICISSGTGSGYKDP